MSYIRLLGNHRKFFKAARGFGFSDIGNAVKKAANKVADKGKDVVNEVAQQSKKLAEQVKDKVQEFKSDANHSIHTINDYIHNLPDRVKAIAIKVAKDSISRPNIETAIRMVQQDLSAITNYKHAIEAAAQNTYLGEKLLINNGVYDKTIIPIFNVLTTLEQQLKLFYNKYPIDLPHETLPVLNQVLVEAMKIIDYIMQSPPYSLYLPTNAKSSGGSINKRKRKHNSK